LEIGQCKVAAHALNGLTERHQMAASHCNVTDHIGSIAAKADPLRIHYLSTTGKTQKFKLKRPTVATVSAQAAPDLIAS
jgi:hypothetical protein